MPANHRDTGHHGQGSNPASARRTRARFFIPAAFLLLLFVLPSLLRGQAAPRAAISRLISQNRLDEAEQQLWSILAQQPDRAWALDLMAEIRVRQRRMPEGEALFHRVVALDSKDIQAHRGLGDLYRSLGKNSEAIESYSQVHLREQYGENWGSQAREKKLDVLLAEVYQKMRQVGLLRGPDAAGDMLVLPPAARYSVAYYDEMQAVAPTSRTRSRRTAKTAVEPISIDWSDNETNS